MEILINYKPKADMGLKAFEYLLFCQDSDGGFARRREAISFLKILSKCL